MIMDMYSVFDIKIALYNDDKCIIHMQLLKKCYNIYYFFNVATLIAEL